MEKEEKNGDCRMPLEFEEVNFSQDGQSIFGRQLNKGQFLLMVVWTIR